jgi:RHS repeat-associated protein
MSRAVVRLTQRLFVLFMAMSGAAVAQIDSRATPTTTLPLSDSGGRVTVDAGAILELRLPERYDFSSIDTQHIALLGPVGHTGITVLLKPASRLIQVKPDQSLLPGSKYTLMLSHLRTREGKPSPIFSLALLTNAIEAAPTPAGYTTDDGERWKPNFGTYGGKDWTTHLPDKSLPKERLLKAAENNTALSGQVLLINNRPLAGVTLEIGKRRTQTDSLGRFLLTDVPAGPQTLVIDGDTVHRGKRYGVYQELVTIKGGQTNLLNHTIWLSRLATEHAVNIPSPTKEDMVIRSPEVPGLELRLPKGTVLRDRYGKIVTQVSLTPIPVDRAPFPLPRLNVPVFFSLQPGGTQILNVDGRVTAGATLTYPNYHQMPPKTYGIFWNYDPLKLGWHPYGDGRVSADGRQVVAQKGAEIYAFTGAMFANPQDDPKGPDEEPDPDCSGSNCTPDPKCEGPLMPGTTSACGDYDPDQGTPKPNESPEGDKCAGGNPVDCATGNLIRHEVDMVVPDVMPIVIQRSYRQNDYSPQAFGYNWTLGYDTYFYSKSFRDSGQFLEADLIKPDGGRIHFVRTSAGTGYSDAILTHYGSQSDYYGATATYEGGNWVVRLRNGSSLSIPYYSSLGAVNDRNGNTLSISRSGLSARRITSPSGRYVDLEVDGANRVSKIIDNTGRSVSYDYDADGYLIKVTYPDGTNKQYTYVKFPDLQQKLLVSVKDRRGNAHTTTEYTRYTAKVSTRFEKVGGVISRTAADTTRVCTVYKPTRQLRADGTVYSTFTWTLDNFCRVMRSEVTELNGMKTVRDFSLDGYLLKQQRFLRDGTALGRIEVGRSDMDPRYSATGGRSSGTAPGNPGSTAGTNFTTSVKDDKGRTISYTYDDRGNVTAVANWEGTMRLSYNAQSLPTSVTNVFGRTVQYGYDTRGNLTSITDPAGRVVRMEYNTRGQITAYTDGAQRTTTFTYDGPDLIRAVDHKGRTMTYTYDTLSRVTQVIDPVGQSFRSAYNAAGMLSSATDPLGQVTRWEYDANGNLTKLTDPAGHASSWTYNTLNQLTTKTDPLGQVSSFTYDPYDNVATFTDRKGQKTTYSYDAKDRLTQVAYADGKSTQYAYDVSDRLTSLTEGSKVISYTYDAQNRMTSETTPQGGIAYTYDALWRLASALPTGQSALTYTYDAEDRLTKINQGSQNVLFGYDALDREVSKTLPNGVTERYDYDDSDRVTGLTFSKGSTTIGTLTYAFDLLGRITEKGGTLAQQGASSTVTSAQYDANNRLTTWGNQPLTYDANGNLLSDGQYTYVWDARNRLIEVRQGGTIIAQFEYDTYGRRVARTVTGTTTTYQYNGSNVIAEKRDTSSATILAGRTDEYFSRTEGSSVRYFLADVLGSTLALADDAGTRTTNYAYSPFGQTAKSGELTGSSYGFTGREEDVAGLYYYRARYYKPEFGRFISEDPIGLTGGINLYAYVENNPVNYTDSSGMFIDIVPDIAFVAYDIYSIGKTLITGCGDLGTDLAALGGDVIGAVAPGVTGVGLGIRAANKADEVIDGARIIPGVHDIGISRPGGGLPRGNNGRPMPDISVPHTQIGTRHGRKGSYTQAREWMNDSNGNLSPTRDIDFTDHSRPSNHTNPHEHWFVPNPSGGTPKHGDAQPVTYPK